MDRHGGSFIVERAFTGFLALPAPNTWRSVFGWDDNKIVIHDEVKLRFKRLAMERHPDRGGSDAQMAELTWAMKEAERELTP